MHFNSREEIIALTPQWTGQRLEDGRPLVEDRYLDALYQMTLEEVWKPIFVLGYENQFEGRLRLLHDDGRKLVGRAVTATYMPTRPDLHETMFEIGRRSGLLPGDRPHADPRLRDDRLQHALPHRQCGVPARGRGVRSGRRRAVHPQPSGG